jgi:hypothetical protein
LTAGELTINDNLLIFYAGHGFWDEKANIQDTGCHMMPEYQEKQNGLATVYCVIILKRLTLSTRTDLASRKNIGSFSNITDIVPETENYIKAYAISDGIISYGDNLYDLFYNRIFLSVSFFLT